MNKEIIKGQLKELKGKFRQYWGKLTEDDVSKLQGSYEELEGLLQKRYGYQKDRIEKEIGAFVDTYSKNRERTE